MSECSYCGSKEVSTTPICQTCGTIRYPVTKSHQTNGYSKQDKLKLSAAVALAILTPGSLFMMALLGVSRITAKIKNNKN